MSDLLNRDQAAIERGRELAGQTFGSAVHDCKNQDELAGFVQMLAIISIKTIHGMDGDQFKKDFLAGAMNDKEMITPVMKQ
ncbi:MAG: hypothetical protein QNK32_05210 [Porticoccus sp.]|nr:hypothetical protein [Porticoccus sp.]